MYNMQNFRSVMLVGAVGIVLRSRIETTNCSFYVMGKTPKTPKTPKTLKSLKTATRRRSPPVPFIFFCSKPSVPKIWSRYKHTSSEAIAFIK
jgi:mannosyltransferase OCH1-like enzyme